jgi:hypothetical protein
VHFLHNSTACYYQKNRSGADKGQQSMNNDANLTNFGIELDNQSCYHRKPDNLTAHSLTNVHFVLANVKAESKHELQNFREKCCIKWSIAVLLEGSEYDIPTDIYEERLTMRSVCNCWPAIYRHGDGAKTNTKGGMS